MEAPDHENTTANEERAEIESATEVQRLKEELRREHDTLLRTLADFDNYRRRIERDRAGAARSGKRDVILSLLEVLDGFDRALNHIDDAPSSVAQGVQAIHRNLLGVLERHGVTRFDSLGEPFDPRFHDAIGTVDSDEVESGTVADELQRGYRWGDEVLRPARVRVAQ
ncbi:MAG TPA: nucleotide exchange factor GrpE [Candidatus Binatia bacterium]|jgi:molecular chaperone GrpE|nr:nucleotide exchange factor GrpE [Candidatus Binatia bacterium]